MELLDAVRRLAAGGDHGVLATAIGGSGPGTSVLLAPNGTSILGVEAPREVVEAVGRVVSRGVPEVVESGDSSWFVEPVLPPPRLVVLGAIAVADALVPMAAAAGWAVVVIDARQWLATSERYPDAASVLCGDPVEMLATLQIDPSTAIVSFLHEPRHEDPVLAHALRSSAAYVGAMGSRRTTAQKRERLAAGGITAEQLESLHAPIGLDIGAVNPREIAVAVLAEVVAAIRGVAYSSKPR